MTCPDPRTADPRDGHADAAGDILRDPAGIDDAVLGILSEYESLEPACGPLVSPRIRLDVDGAGAWALCRGSALPRLSIDTLLRETTSAHDALRVRALIARMSRDLVAPLDAVLPAPLRDLLDPSITLRFVPPERKVAVELSWARPTSCGSARLSLDGRRFHGFAAALDILAAASAAVGRTVGDIPFCRNPAVSTEPGNALPGWIVEIDLFDPHDAAAWKKLLGRNVAGAWRIEAPSAEASVLGLFASIVAHAALMEGDPLPPLESLTVSAVARIEPSDRNGLDRVSEILSRNVSKRSTS